MSNNTPILTFRETLQGPFALGVTNPEDGGKKGLTEGTSLSLHTDFSIHDLSHPRYRGSLTATIDFKHLPFENGFLSVGAIGIFNLTGSHKDDLSGTASYELSFHHGGKTYFLTGEKKMGSIEIWGDTTTLDVYLYEGKDGVIGAGKLATGPDALSHLIGSLEVHNASNDAERLRIIHRFGRILLGPLWKEGGKGEGNLRNSSVPSRQSAKPGRSIMWSVTLMTISVLVAIGAGFATGVFEISSFPDWFYNYAFSLWKATLG